MNWDVAIELPPLQSVRDQEKQEIADSASEWFRKESPLECKEIQTAMMAVREAIGVFLSRPGYNFGYIFSKYSLSLDETALDNVTYFVRDKNNEGCFLVITFRLYMEPMRIDYAYTFI